MNSSDRDEPTGENENRDLAKLGSEAVPSEPPTAAELMKELALSGGIQALWAVVFPLVGVRSDRSGEFPGVFQVEPGPAPHEALVHIDIPSTRYEVGKKPEMHRVVSLSVKLAHDFRRLGNRYYCIDCETSTDETRH